MNETKVFELGELYCGAGGLAAGVLSAASADGRFRISHAWASDYHADACETYRRNLCPDRPDSVICSDVRDLDLAALDRISAFAYGFPCNSFSAVGEHQGLADTKFGQLYWYGIEVLRHHRPDWFMAENVGGIRSAGCGGDFRVILQDMADSGYRLYPHLYRSEDYGVPQLRHRVIIVGIRDDLKVAFQVPSPVPYAQLDVSARTALADIPQQAANHEVRPVGDRVARRLSLIEPGENIWQAEARLPEDLKIHTRTKISQIYRKLDPDRPGYTVTACGGGGTAGYHWTDRELTNRERARLQTFADDFVFTGSYASVRRQIGMAVPCRLAGIIAAAVLNSFAGIDYCGIAPNISLEAA